MAKEAPYSKGGGAGGPVTGMNFSRGFGNYNRTGNWPKASGGRQPVSSAQMEAGVKKMSAGRTPNARGQIRSQSDSRPAAKSATARAGNATSNRAVAKARATVTAQGKKTARWMLDQEMKTGRKVPDSFKQRAGKSYSPRQARPAAVKPSAVGKSSAKYSGKKLPKGI